MILRQPGAEASWRDDGKKPSFVGKKFFFCCALLCFSQQGVLASPNKYANTPSDAPKWLIMFLQAYLHERQE